MKFKINIRFGYLFYICLLLLVLKVSEIKSLIQTGRHTNRQTGMVM